MIAEVWRAVPGAEGRYEVSSLGRIRSLLWGEPRLLSPSPNGAGYPTLGLAYSAGTRSRTVHALVLEAFRGVRPAGMQVRHLNGDRTDNRLSNLVYGTASQNQQDCLDHGTHPHASKTHCRNGHPFDSANTIRAKRGNGRIFRQCRTCHNALMRARRVAISADQR